MSIACKFERSLLSHEEYAVVKGSHHPELYDLNLKDLLSLQNQLRQMRDKERTLSRQKQREQRGKAEPRGGSFPGTGEQPQQRKQVFANALKRVNKEAARIRKVEARTANIEAAHRALAMRRAANFTSHPAAGQTANEGMTARPNRRRKTIVSGSRIGSVSQATKVAQAVRDNKR